MRMKEMTNEETATHLRKYVEGQHGTFSWPTDACGYDQHIKFVKHRNAHIDEISNMDDAKWKKFVLDYADSLTANPY